ncbi:hypothetical protein CYG48_05905 [Neorhizobium sp. SOG26]|uniref:hypothetical protein n=1 Tax=Neorhizobium sp. SOG26 TaxID=2060726 RepID=UPI000E58AD39|nr:hypothetical protein [Neorhizobium sp. SOG26]AXV15278.1 hypothetical protein CYG48_05905 [Neorhizobium sp. SOG26]
MQHAQIKDFERVLLPRGLVARPTVKRFKFRKGALVRFHDNVCVVHLRFRDGGSGQSFTVEIISGTDGGRPIRHVRGEFLTRYNPVSQPVASTAGSAAT